MATATAMAKTAAKIEIERPEQAVAIEKTQAQAFGEMVQR